MNDYYQRLALELDRIPNGFPKTESGVELKLLAKLFTPEDAALASTLSLEPKSLKEIAEVNNLEESEAKSRLIGMVEYGSENSIARSEFYAVADPDLCSGCEVCLDRCAFNAITINEGICEVERATCYGCGLCISTCETDALSLVRKTPDEYEPPPVDDEAWRRIRAASRSMQ